MVDESANPEFIKPKMTLKVTTYELVSPPNKWEASVSHEFYGNTVEEAFKVLQAHMEIDTFFSASFTGKFPYKGHEIILKNSEIESI